MFGRNLRRSETLSTFFSTSGLARLSARHPWRVIAAWGVVLLFALVASRGLAKSLTSDVSFTGMPDSRRGLILLQQGFGTSDLVTETVVVHSDRLTVDDPAFQQVVRQTTSALLGLHGVVGSATNYYQAQAVAPAQAAALVSADRHSTLIPVTMSGGFNQVKPHVDEYLSTVRAQSTPQVEVLTVGGVSINQVSNQVAEQDLRRAEILTLVPSLLILIVVFGALVAAGLPIVLSGVSILTAIGLTALVGRVTDISYFVVNMITMIGLAVGIDYALFIISRYREERGAGLERRAAIRVTGATASKAALFSGITVVLALSGLLLLPATVFHSLGIGAVLVVLVALAAMLTLVPALLRVTGDRLDWPRRRATERQRSVDGEAPLATTGFWARVAHLVMGRPVISLTLATLLLLALAIPVYDLQLGTTGAGSLPDSDVERAYTLLNQQFSAGLLAPVEIVVAAQRTPAMGQAIDTLVGELEKDPSYLPRAQLRWNAPNDMAEITIPLAVPPDSQQALDAISRLRRQQIPGIFTGAPAEIYVTGTSAVDLDFRLLVDHYTPFIFAYVLGLSFLLLLLAFRSIVVPIKAILMNLLSVGASFGLLVLVFQKGYLHALLGLRHTPVIEAWIPIFLFCVLFGLSMDYHVFLLSRIREHYDLSHDNRESVAVGLTTTARIITGAALIMVVVFAGFAAGRLVLLQQVGFGLAVAIFLDATIVRIVIVPAAMTLLGDANWYLPAWLSWLPDLRIENLPQQPAAGVVAVPAPGIVDCARAYGLLDLATIALCAVLAGADSFAEIAAYAQTRREWLATFLRLPDDAPAQEDFVRLFAALDPAQLEPGILPRIRALVPAPGEPVLPAMPADPLALVRVWARGRHLILGEVDGTDQPDGAGALSETLGLLSLRQAIVTAGAADGGAIAVRLVDQGADYIVAFGREQEGEEGEDEGTATERLTREIARIFNEAEARGYAGIAHSYQQTRTQADGCSRQRRAWLIHDPSCLQALKLDAAWPAPRSIALVEWEEGQGEALRNQYGYYLSSLGDGVQPFAAAAERERYSVNGITRLLDVAYGEEHDYLAVDHAAENLRQLRRIAFQLLEEDRSVSARLAAKRLKAGRDERYLLAVLAG